MLTMHRAKGREFDYAVMIVDPLAHSAATTIDELRRHYYVAATRARKGLAVVYVPGEAGPVWARCWVSPPAMRRCLSTTRDRTGLVSDG